MNDSALNIDVNVTRPNANTHTNAQGFDLSLFPMPGIFHGLAEQSAGRAKENCEKMKVASGEIADNLREAYASNAKGAADYGAKVMEISSLNVNAAFDFLGSFMAAKSLSDVLNLSATQSRKNLEVASTQNRELWELAQRAAAETAEPIKKSFTKVLHPIS